MPTIVVKGYVEFEELAELERVYVEIHGAYKGRGFDDWFISLAVRGLKEVMKDGQANGDL